MVCSTLISYVPVNPSVIDNASLQLRKNSVTKGRKVEGVVVKNGQLLQLGTRAADKFVTKVFHFDALCMRRVLDNN